MTWSVYREGGVIHADIHSLEAGEWEALLLAVEAEMKGPPISQVVIHAGERPPPVHREALVESLSKILSDEGIKVRVVFARESEADNPGWT